MGYNTMTPEQRKRMTYHPEKVTGGKKSAKRMSNAEAEAAAKEAGVTVEEIRAMENEAANEASAREGYKKGGMVNKPKYAKGGMANCGASMKPTQKSTSAVKMACGGMASKKKK